jgi:hypothetical protein
VTENEANAPLLAMLLFDRREWPAAQIDAWRHAIRQCADPDAALEASDTLVRNADPRDWSLHRWHVAYQDALRRREARHARPVLEEPVISLDEYLTRLSFRALDGDDEAAEEYDRFQRHRFLFEAGFPAPVAPW